MSGTSGPRVWWCPPVFSRWAGTGIVVRQTTKKAFFTLANDPHEGRIVVTVVVTFWVFFI